jgi:hypothetical protein
MRNSFSITRRIELHLTPEEWGLIPDDLLGEQAGKIKLPKGKDVARALNGAVADAINLNTDDPAKALQWAHQVLQIYRANGAADTEGYETVDYLMVEFFGSKAVTHYKNWVPFNARTVNHD